MNFFEVAKPTNPIHNDTKVIFVADLFAEEYTGGAELTSEALIKSCPYKIQKLRCREVTKAIVDMNRDKVWVFGNISSLNPAVMPAVMGGCKYVVLEYDYKFCAHRSLEKHLALEGKPCDCENRQIGDLISTFFNNSDGIFWMSEKQQDIYRTKFPSLEDKDQFVLSSVFDEEFFMSLKILRQKYENHNRTEWLVFKSNSWIKGTDAAVKYCKDNNLPYKEISGLSYEDMLEELAKAKGLVFLPPGGDTCPRMVIEAKLLGCELVLNDNVQHAREIWFDTSDLEEVEQYLYASRELFWNFVKNEIVEKVLSLSGYTTTYNCVSQKYPFEQCVESMMGFCDEVVVVDGGSSDGTLARLVDLGLKHDPESAGSELAEDLKGLVRQYERGEKPHVRFQIGKLVVKVVNRDWTSPRFAVFDGLQKAEARSLCTGDYCWQMDSDEIVHEDDYAKVRGLMSQFPKGINLISLPVIEYWGGPEKVRLDVTPWKWRISRNLPSITHGIPSNLRQIDASGQVYALPGTDGCDMIHARTGDSIPFIGFYIQDAHTQRTQALEGNDFANLSYGNWFAQVVKSLPSVHHFSWFNMERKIHTYKNYWSKHWQSLYDQKIEDTAANNMFFNMPWSDVTEDMIKELAEKLKSECGGWIWHRKWNGEKTPAMKLDVDMPKLAKDFYGR